MMREHVTRAVLRPVKIGLPVTAGFGAGVGGWLQMDQPVLVFICLAGVFFTAMWTTSAVMRAVRGAFL